MLLMPAKRHIATDQKTLVFEKSGAEVPDWEEPVKRLVQALEQDEFELYAQRIVALAKPKAAPMAEVLLRMRQEERMLPPGSFLPVFERCGMMPELDRWVMRRAIARLAREPRVPSLSLNISGQTLSDADFPPAVATELSRHRVHHRWLRLQPCVARAAAGVEAELRQGWVSDARAS